MKIDLLKLLFTIIIGLTIFSIFIDPEYSLFIYLFFYWFWLTITNKRLFKFDDSPKFGRTLHKLNIILFSILISFDIILLFLFAASFGTLVPTNFLNTAFLSTAIIYFISTSLLIYVALKNIQLSNPTANSNKVFLELIIFPVGLWTIPKSYLNIKYADT